MLLQTDENIQPALNCRKLFLVDTASAHAACGIPEHLVLCGSPVAGAVLPGAVKPEAEAAS